MGLIQKPTLITAAGKPPKQIEEYVGRVNTQTSEVSIARMVSPPGWAEPGQTPEFDEWSVVLNGTLRVETREGTLDIHPGSAYHCVKGRWVRFSTPQGAEYLSVCLPAFSPQAVKRDS